MNRNLRRKWLKTRKPLQRKAFGVFDMSKDVQIKQFNGTDFENIYPKINEDKLINAYIWERVQKQENILFRSKSTAYSTAVIPYRVNSIDIEYSDSFEYYFASNRIKLRLVSPNVITFSRTDTNPSKFSVLAGKYCSLDSNGISVYFNNNNATFSLQQEGQTYNLKTSNGDYYRDPYVETKYIHKGYVITYNNVSPVEEGYTFLKVLQPQSKLTVEKGSYQGSGTYGYESPNSLSFSKPPLMVMLTWNTYNNGQNLGNRYLGNYQTGDCVCAYLDGLDTSPYSQGAFFRKHNAQNAQGWKSPDNKTIYWYDGNSAYAQFNSSGDEYYYLAFFME